MKSWPRKYQTRTGDDPRRRAVREWLAVNPKPTGRQLAEAALDGERDAPVDVGAGHYRQHVRT